MKNYINERIIEAEKVIRVMYLDETLKKTPEQSANACIKSLRCSGKIFLVRNGGSIADAKHISGEFVSRFAFDRSGLPAIALLTVTSVLMAIGNDYGY